MATIEGQFEQGDGSGSGNRDEAEQQPSTLEVEIERGELIQPDSLEDAPDPRVEARQMEKLSDLAQHLRRLTPDLDSSQDTVFTTLLSDLDAATLDKSTASTGYTLLHLAARHNLPHAARMLINKGASSKKLSIKSRSPLQLACRYGNLAVSKVLIDEGAADVNRARPVSPLMYASKYGFNDLIDLLLEAKAKPGVVNRKQWSALHYACWWGQAAAAKRLLAHHSKGLNDKDTTYGLTPLGMAVKRGHEHVVEVVLKDTGTFDPSDKSHPLRIDLEATDEHGQTMLAIAAQAGYTGIFEALLKAGADCLVTFGEFGETALMHGCRYGHLDIVTKLFDLRGNDFVNMADMNQETALHKAASSGNAELVEILVKNKAKIDARDKLLWTPLHKACEQGHLEVVRNLLSHGAKATAMTRRAMTSVHIACSSSVQGKPHQDSPIPGSELDDKNDEDDTKSAVSSETFGKIITALLAGGCNPFLEDHNKKSAFHYASSEGGRWTTLTFLVSAVEKHYFAEAQRNYPAEAKVLLWATEEDERHDIVKFILSHKQPLEESLQDTPPPESRDWNVIEWATFRGYPRVLLPLLAVAVRSATPRTLDRAIKIAEAALKKQRKDDTNEEVASRSDRTVRPDIPTVEVDRYTVRDLLRYPLFAKFSTQEIKLQAPVRMNDRKGLLQAWTASIIQFHSTKEGASIFLRRDRSVWDVIYREGPAKIINDEKDKLGRLVDQLKATSAAGKALSDQLGYLDRSSRDATFSWIHLPANNMVWMNHLLQKVMYENLKIENNQKTSQEPGPITEDSTYHTTYDELTRRREKEFQEMSYFLNDSWSQIPDGASRFRMMRPCFVKSSKENLTSHKPTLKSSTSNPGDLAAGSSQPSIQGGSPKASRGAARGAFPRSNSGSADLAFKDDHGSAPRTSPSAQTIQAIYLSELPYLVFSKYHKDETSMTLEERSKLPLEKVTQGKQAPNQDSNESDDTDAESVLDAEDDIEFNEQMEAIRGSGKKVKSDNDLLTAKQETPKSKWNVLRQRAKMHDDMAKAYSDSVVHQCSTLDESFYHFEADNEDAENDRQYRNATQIVTKNVKKSRRSKKQDGKVEETRASTLTSGVGSWQGGKGEDGVQIRVTSVTSKERLPSADEAPLSLGERTASGLKGLAKRSVPGNQGATDSANPSVDQSPDEDLQWPILRVNQLWVWVIGEKWLITSTTDPLDDVEKPFITGFLGHLNKQAAAGRMHTQPQTTFDISRALVDYCIGAYDRIPEGLDAEGGHKRSIRQIFSQSINDIATEETKLYKRFRTQKKADRGVLGSKWHVASSRKSSQQIEDNMWRAISLSHELRDVKDELNMLASIAKYQAVVQKDQRKGGPLQAEKSAVHVVDDINEMEKMADRLQSSIDMTLTLEQNEISIAEAQETVKQGKILMAFTLITIIFLPLSFLATFFAIDFSDFLKTPFWVHIVIFVGSFAFSGGFLYVAFTWDHLRNKLQKHAARSQQGPGLTHEAGSISGQTTHGSIEDGAGKPEDIRSGMFGRRHYREKDMDKSALIC